MLSRKRLKHIVILMPQETRNKCGCIIRILKMAKFKELLNASIKSKDTEEWLDMHFNRPVGLVMALAGKRLGIHPTAITAVSIIFGIGAAWMFAHTDIYHNMLGIALLMLANFCDSADGQLARLANKKTLVGRVLDGFAGDIWFFCIYFALCVRMTYQTMPGTDVYWGLWIWVLAFIAGVLCHSPQSSLADYYRQIHLLFLKGKEGSELDTYASQRAIFENLPKGSPLIAKMFYFNYANYCKSQERRSRSFQKMMNAINKKYGDVAQMPEELRNQFLTGSRPLMKYTNILTFNMRAICLYVTSIAGCPWVYMMVEIIVFNIIYVYMHKKHENLCDEITEKILKEDAV